LSDPNNPNGEPWPPGGQAPQPYGQPQPPYDQQPEYGQPAYGQPPFGQTPTPYGQQPPYSQPGPFDRTNPFDQSQGLNAAPTTPYGQQAAFGQQPYDQPYGQQAGYGTPSPYGQPGPDGYGAQGGQGGFGGQGFGGQGFYPQPVPPKKNTGKIIAGIGAVVVVIVIIAAITMHGSSPSNTPTGSSTVSQTPVVPSATDTDGSDSTAPDSDATTDDSGSNSSDTDYTMGECVNLSGDNDNLVVTEVDCTSANSSGQVVGIVSSGTTGDPTADAPLCMPFKYDDNDFEETGDGDGTGVLYCLSATNGEHDLRYATTGSCIYRPKGDDVVTYVVDCSNKLANYVTLGVLTNTTSDSKCDNYSNDSENFFSPDGETPSYVVCTKDK
jgi:hypothetical protein